MWNTPLSTAQSKIVHGGLMAAVITETKTRSGVPVEVESALRLWGAYRQNRPRGPAGYPTQSPFVRLMEYGKLGITGPSTRPEDELPGVVDNIERIFRSAPHEICRVLEIQYRTVDEIGHEPTREKKAALLGLSMSTYRNRVESAQWYVFGRMRQ